MTALGAMLTRADRQRLLERLAELRDTDREMRQAGTLAAPREPVPLHRAATAPNRKPAVARLCCDHTGIPLLNRRRVAPSTNTERDQQIAAAARLGQTHEAIAQEHGLTRARVSQIVAAANPRSPEEAERHLIAERLRSRWDELEKIVRNPPIRTTSIGRTQFDIRTCSCPTKARTDRDHADDCEVQPVLDMSAVTGAIKLQLAIEAQYRAMFGVDLGTRPGPLLDEAQIIMRAEITVAQQYLSPQGTLPPLPPLPAGYHTMTAEQQARAAIERLREQRAALPAAPLRVIQGETVT